MFKHTQAICWCLSVFDRVFDHFVALALKRFQFHDFFSLQHIIVNVSIPGY